ncbi:enoyl-CoA hydratase/isomerase family protein [Candidatus Thioglobus sp.]|uniref:enoyl-CoA hydratase/isomerase family protein n=1 Tax=Candidatus Thioglobus sp. TaxID=2026721 RepID=UPI003D0FD424
MSKLHIALENKIATVVIDNPPANIWTVDTINEVNEFILSLQNDNETKAVVFKSAHKLFFVAHLDLNTINGAESGKAGIMAFSQMIKNIKAMNQLSIVLVDGIARGGGNEFVMACDLSYGTENAAFAQPEIGVNIPTGGQGAVQFARRMGKGKGLQALLTGEDFSSQQAEALNIITKYIPKTQLDTYLNSFLEALAGLELRDIMMYKDIVSVSIRDEEAGAHLELRYFLERANEAKTQTIIKAFLKSGGQTEREATDFQGVFTDTAAELGLNQE